MWPPLPAGSSVNASGGNAGPSRSEFGPSSIGFDSSGWTVATGSGTASGAISPLVLAGAAILALLIVWRLTKKS